MEKKYIGTSARGVTKEIEIPVPWGKIAGKVYGDPSNAPVLCIHGWLDNCNTFDKLMPLLHKDRYFVLIDLPGHGLSSMIPDEMLYLTYLWVNITHRIINYFNWTTFSFLSHSIGAAISVFYAGTFPEKVDKLIILDVVRVHPMPVGKQVQWLRSKILDYSKVEKLQSQSPLSDTYEEAKARLLAKNRLLSGEAADVLLERSLLQDEEGTFRFARDLRHRYRKKPDVDYKIGLQFSRSVAAETLHIISEDGVMKDLPKSAHKLCFYLMENGFTSCQYHRHVSVKGGHHVHLCHPERVASHINSILQRPPRSGLSKVQSRL